MILILKGKFARFVVINDHARISKPLKQIILHC